MSDSCGSYGLELIERLANHLGQVESRRLLDPPFECHPKHGDPGFSRQGGDCILDAALAEGVDYFQDLTKRGIPV
jgi:hypothetical protein